MMMARRQRTDIFEKRVHRFIWDIVETEKAPSLRHIQSECVGFWAIETQWVGLRRMTSQKSSYDLDHVRQKLGVLLRHAVTVGFLAVAECSDGRQGDIAKTEVLKLYICLLYDFNKPGQVPMSEMPNQRCLRFIRQHESVFTSTLVHVSSMFDLKVMNRVVN